MNINTIQLRYPSTVIRFKDFTMLGTFFNFFFITLFLIFLEQTHSSLDSFGRRYGLEVRKYTFPHQISSSVAFLKKTKYMPEDRDSWMNTLTSQLTDTKIIKNTVKLFKESGAKNLYDFLCIYLKMDILILKKGINSYRTLQYQQLGYDFILLRKYTISSLCYTIGYSLNLQDKPLHVAPYKIQNTPIINNIIDQSVVGGLTVCSALSNVGSHWLINSHLKYGHVKNISKNSYPGLYRLKKVSYFNFLIFIYIVY